MHTNRLSLYQIKLLAYLQANPISRGKDLTNGMNFNPGSYKMLHRLEEEKLIASKERKSGRYYRLSTKGINLLKEVRKELKLLLA